jgi:hypothetical protein
LFQIIVNPSIMADVAGTVVGLISFGITVCDGLTTYYQAWEARDDDISTALKSIAQLRNTLALLTRKLANFQNIESTFNAHVLDSLSLMEDKLKKLGAILENCRIECPRGPKEWLVDLSRRAAYPFRKKTINDLQSLIRDLMNNLSLVLEVLHL